MDDGTHIGLSFPIVTEIPSGSTINKAYVSLYTDGYSGGTCVFKCLVENSDPATAAVWGSSHLPSGGSWVATNSNQSRAFSVDTWYFGESETHPINLNSDVGTLLSTYGTLSVGDRINIAYIWQSGGYTAFVDYNKPDYSAYRAKLYIDWTASAGGIAIPVISRQFQARWR
jgi:hypothetical protein